MNSTPTMKVSVLTIGDEILRGRTVDSNFSYIAKKLFNIGLELGQHRVVGDVEDEIVEAMISLTKVSDIVFITGGLGPTPDDLTRHAIAKFLDKPLKLYQDELDKMKKRFEKRGIDMPPSNEIQVEFPDGVETIYNPVGMAPGMYFQKDETRFWALPGVPREMKTMLTEIIDRLDMGGGIDKLILRTTGIPESSLYDHLRDDISDYDDFIGYYPSVGGVDIVIHGDDSEEIADIIRPKLDGLKYSEIEGMRFEQVIQELMIDRELTLSCAESCTGGMLSSAIVDIPGSSDYFLGGVVSYTNDAKNEILNVPLDILMEHGAVSPQTASHMAEGAMRLFGSDYALSTTGVAGPSGGTDEKPVGLVYVALATNDITYCRKYTFNNTREVNRQRSKYAALYMLWLHLNNKLQSFDFKDGSTDAMAEINKG